MKALSTIFECCGYDGPQDFNNQSSIANCCQTNKDVGCALKTIDSIEKNAIQVILIPNVVVLVLELIMIITIPILVSRIRRSKDFAKNKEVNYLVPTNEYRQSYGSNGLRS